MIDGSLEGGTLSLQPSWLTHRSSAGLFNGIESMQVLLNSTLSLQPGWLPHISVADLSMQLLLCVFCFWSSFKHVACCMAAKLLQPSC